ncbi:hypothetical protein A33M_1443 [Rhodovulum sp. PH10]|uniref:protein phosphatase CheZ n=1 Tax=Rhodovulum sp. PH10 TaxID=1187851 RepID=UPI00027C2AF5|nr:protein phosphatase CheZ [Rhodovulum sp. PH10]EJW12881.1 hypothetical protein A33M_1443 [Rhodovulum sp. PH10]
MQPRKTFRVEQFRAPVEVETPGEQIPPASATDADAVLRHLEIVTEIRGVRALIEGRALDAQRALEKFQAQFAEYQKVKAELDVIEHAITETKRELATIHVTGFNGQEMSRVANELDTVVEDTEHATEAILGLVEQIDEQANVLAGSVQSEADQAAVQLIQDSVVKVFEACNFQDLTGQRISKVVAVLKFIEAHIQRMEEIWGGIESFEGYAPVDVAEKAEEDKLLNGPKLEGDVGHVSQNDIDALFD